MFGLVLLALSFGAALSAPEEDGEPATTTRQNTRSNTPAAIVTTLRHPVRGRPPVRRVRSGTHVVLRVSAGVAGNVEITGLGLLQPVAPGTPAVFDLLAVRPDHYEVALVTLTGERIAIGRLAVGR